MFRVIAILAVRNEEDIISQVLEDLIRQRIDVYLIDDGSTDSTIAEASTWLGRGLIDVERRAPTREFQWTEILLRKEELALTLEADWFLHQDADEFRESPWPQWDLNEAVRQVDSLGYNAIDFRVLNFPATHDEWVPRTDIRSTFHRFEPAAPCDQIQIKAWKRSVIRVDLASSGGHEAKFPGRLVSPIRFLSRHYPIRGDSHGRRKVLLERRPRFSQSELDRGWHVQYRDASAGEGYLKEPSSLQAFDPEAVRLELLGTSRDSEQLAAAQLEVSQLNAKVIEATTVSADLRQEVERLQIRITELTADAERERNQYAIGVASWHKQLQTHRDRLDAFTRDLMKAQNTLVKSETQAVALKDQLAAVYSSKSWRVTGPLRRAYELLNPGVFRGPVDSAAPSAAPKPFDYGALDRRSPISFKWGFDRGLPIDRYYIELFLQRYGSDVKGHVLEIKDSGYTRRFGGDKVVRSSVLDIREDNPSATVIGDLAGAASLQVSNVDCFILTQTLHIIFDVDAAIRRAVELLRPGGILLCTLPAVSRVNDEDGGLDSGDFWRFTQAAASRLFTSVPEIASSVEITTYGNVQTCAAFLYGLAVEDMTAETLDYHDPWFPLVHTIRAVKTS